ncbi:hypothetical protein CPB86DRAFT_827927 [Serendipita vermifera]|nr:hypothetical protein CPB86DRAFT_827927 [Serendipita vermifera]
MTSIASLYNTLPTLKEARNQLEDKEGILSKLVPILAKYENQYGVCLVHRHCTLEEGEAMVAEGNVSQPETSGSYYPERWLSTGEPYEFNREPCKSPPENLLKEFQEAVGEIHVLGLFFVNNSGKADEIAVERTEGRKNIVTIVPKDSPMMVRPLDVPQETLQMS